jgi:hypothetical protein
VIVVEATGGYEAPLVAELVAALGVVLGVALVACRHKLLAHCVAQRQIT